MLISVRKIGLRVLFAFLTQGCVEPLDLDSDLPNCGDGKTEVFEECDDGNRIGGDGCSDSCVVENGWDCSNGNCETVCGDGRLFFSEQCDDGNSFSGDGCDKYCKVESRFQCLGEGPASCTCLPQYAGASCSGCSERFTGPNCAECSNPAFAAPSCTTCLPQFTGANCEQCIEGVTGSSCDECINPGFAAPSCTSCLPQFMGTNCDQCSDARFTGANCDQCRAPGGSLNTSACPTWLQSSANNLYFMKTEVTVAQYMACVGAGACTRRNYDTNSTSTPDCNFGERIRSSHPMNCVDWYGAGEYCTWVGARLPTEDEWYAEASNNGSRAYPWGDTPQASCTHCVMKDLSAGGSGCGNRSTMPVGSKPLGDSVSGVSDLSGNVWEWITTPSGNLPVLRGGSWFDDNRSYLQASARLDIDPSLRGNRIGFRCVSDTGPQ